MFNKLMQTLKNLTSVREPINPATFNDPIATQTEWTPAKGGGTNIRTHALVEAGFDRLEFKATWGARFFYLIFLFVGLGVMFGIPIAMLSAEESPGFTILFPILFGLVFATVGGCLYWFGTAPIVFDKQSGYFWKGRKSPEQVFSPSDLKNCAELGEIHALQLLSEYCRSSGKNSSSYYSYELNLILKDATRINVVDHGKQHEIRTDAATLSEFLGVPVWDAI